MNKEMAKKQEAAWYKKQQIIKMYGCTNSPEYYTFLLKNRYGL
jgi:hypothetical protein